MITNPPAQKRRGRPVGPKNKRKKKKTTPMNGETMFEAAFGHVSPAPQQVVDNDAAAFFPNQMIQ